MITFDDFTPGGVVGTTPLTVDEDIVSTWQDFVGEPLDPAALPPSLTMALVMRSYMMIMPERTPGNVHAQQKLKIERPLRAGETVQASLICTDKQVRKERNWVYLETRFEDQAGQPICVGEIWMVWAK